MEVQLVVADWCPRCPRAKVIWRLACVEAGVPYEEVEISSAKGQELAAQFHIKAVPAVIVNQTLCPNACRDVEQARSALRGMTGGAAKTKAPR